MLKYINILLDDASTSFCYYEVTKIAKPISEEILDRGIRFAMKENLNVQFVYPSYDLPDYVDRAVQQIDHIKIGKEDIIVYNSYPLQFEVDKICVLRLSKDTLLSKPLPDSLPTRLNIVITDIMSFKDTDFDDYDKWLKREATKLKERYGNINILSDRVILDKMNNCNAGWESITLAPNGKFYICPAFYQNDMDSVGDLQSGLKIPNAQLYRLDHSPICKKCDAFQCKRCVWLNQETTLEVNIPSHEQCVIAHLERNASRIIKNSIPEIDYLDPFNLIER